MERSNSATTLGSYSPVLLRATVTKRYRPADDHDDTTGDLALIDLPTFFHEFAHHIQNVSTIIGLSHFDCLIAIWHSTRNITHEPTDHESLTQLSNAILNIKRYTLGNRYYKGTPTLSVTLINESDTNLSDRNPATLTFLDGENEVELSFGIAEFFESAAYSLETFFRKKIGMTEHELTPPSVPYKMGDCIGRFYNSEYSDIRLITIYLTAMQHAAPHRAFIKLAREMASADIDDETAKSILGRIATQLINDNERWVKTVGEQLEEGFPHEDLLFGDIIKSIFGNLQTNLTNRLSKPFPELDFLLSINKDNFRKELNELVNYIGGCTIVFKDPIINLESEKVEDRILELGNRDSVFRESRAWDTFRACIHYARRQIQDRGDSIQVVSPQESACPIFSHCTHINKKTWPSTCSSTPWAHVKAAGDGSDCPYQLATYKTDLSNIKISRR